MARYYDARGEFIGEDGDVFNEMPISVDMESFEALEKRAIDAERKLSTALNALRAAKHELEITTHECEGCGKSTPAKDADLFDQLAHDLAALGDPCDGEHMPPECADPQCWRRK